MCLRHLSRSWPEPRWLSGAETVIELQLKGRNHFTTWEERIVAQRRARNVAAVFYFHEPKPEPDWPNPIRMGYESVKALISHLRGEEVKLELDTGAVVVTKENMSQPEMKDLHSPDLAKWLED